MSECRDGKPGCEAITIPHNSNWSKAERPSPPPQAPGSREDHLCRRSADPGTLRSAWSRSSSTRASPSAHSTRASRTKAAPSKRPRTACAPERTTRSKPSTFPARCPQARPRSRQGSLGVRIPFAFGQIGSTDTHLGTPGLVAERGHPGPRRRRQARAHEVFEDPGLPDIATLNPGGLAVVWAEENARDSIYRRHAISEETYATSGTRPELTPLRRLGLRARDLLR